MKLLLLVTMLAGSTAMAALPGTQVSKLTLGADELAAPPIALPPMADRGSDAVLAAQVELLKLQAVSLAGPVFTVAISGTTFIVGAGVFFISAFGGSFAFVVGLMMMGGAAIPLAAGIVWWLTNAAHNSKVESAVRRFEDERKSLGGVSQLPTGDAKLFELAAF